MFPIGSVNASLHASPIALKEPWKATKCGAHSWKASLNWSSMPFPMAFPTPSKWNNVWPLGNMAPGTRKDTPTCSTEFTHKRKPIPGMITKKPRVNKTTNRLQS
eukprot:12956918-Heterocapsa_arctica.AAC.1